MSAKDKYAGKRGKRVLADEIETYLAPLAGATVLGVKCDVVDSGPLAGVWTRIILETANGQVTLSTESLNGMKPGLFHVLESRKGPFSLPEAVLRSEARKARKAR
jgi:hypothetical protein